MRASNIWLVVIFFSVCLLSLLPGLVKCDEKETTIVTPTSVVKKERIQIVVHDKIRGYLNWLQDWFQEAARTQCSTECLITEDRSKMESADIVLFHAPTHGKSGLLPNNKLKRKAEQVYAFVSMEQPKYARFLADRIYLKNFDLLLTYSLSSVYPGTKIPNMPITYYPLNIVPVEAILETPLSFGNKTGYGTGVSIAAFISNCKKGGAETRTEYLQQLMKSIPVHSYGGCLKNREEPVMEVDKRWPHVAQKRARKIKILSNYKFYLAFENSQVEDYVSEKAFESLFAGAIPIYRGAERISLFMPSKESYIDANKMAPHQVAAIVKKLENDEDLYNNYMAYKSKPISQQFHQIALDSFTHPNVMCRLCEYASRKKSRRQLTDDEMNFNTSNSTNPLLQFVRWEGDHYAPLGRQ